MKINLFSILIAASMCATVCNAQSHPTREVKMPKETGLGVDTSDYSQKDKGFFAAGEATGGYSLESGKENIGFTDVTFVGGYRFNDFLRVGAGIGARRYFDSDDVRFMSHDWGMPLFIHARGNFIHNAYRDVVPFWSLDFGTTFPDGMMVRPTFGIRVGQPRSAFIAAVGYMGQNIRTFRIDNQVIAAKHKFYSFITLKIGYEF